LYAPSLIADHNVTSGLNICKIMRKIEVKSRSISFLHVQNNVIFHLYWFNSVICLIQELVDPGSTLIQVGAYDPESFYKNNGCLSSQCAIKHFKYHPANEDRMFF